MCGGNSTTHEGFRKRDRGERDNGMREERQRETERTEADCAIICNVNCALQDCWSCRKLDIYETSCFASTSLSLSLGISD